MCVRGVDIKKHCLIQCNCLNCPREIIIGMGGVILTACHDGLRFIQSMYTIGLNESQRQRIYKMHNRDRAMVEF